MTPRAIHHRRAVETGGRPARLLQITLGNLRNSDLLEHVTTHHEAVIAAFDEADFVELGATGLTLHPRS